MNTAIVNVKVDRVVKKQAQKTAEQLGLSLSAVINGFLRQFVKTKTVTFTQNEEPSDYLIHTLKESAADIKAGRVISFDNEGDELRYLDNLIAHDKKSQQG